MTPKEILSAIKSKLDLTVACFSWVRGRGAKIVYRCPCIMQRLC